MNGQNYHLTLQVQASAHETFAAITNVSQWWTADLKGPTQQTGDVFTVTFGKTYITLKVIEMIPDQKIVWLVSDCNKPWLQNVKEWNGTTICFELSEKDEFTTIHFKHIGLLPEIECFEVCSTAWAKYLEGGLLGSIGKS